jgi:large subunit ribosomal protein L28
MCGKKIAYGNNVSHSHHKTNRTWRPNVQKTILMLDGKPTRVNACTRCIRTAKKRAA